jgi:hypothetical protein
MPTALNDLLKATSCSFYLTLRVPLPWPDALFLFGGQCDHDFSGQSVNVALRRS